MMADFPRQKQTAPLGPAVHKAVKNEQQRNSTPGAPPTLVRTMPLHGPLSHLRTHPAAAAAGPSPAQASEADFSQGSQADINQHNTVGIDFQQAFLQLLADMTPEDNPSIRIGVHLFSRLPNALDDFSGRTFAARMLHLCERMKGVDGAEDSATAAREMLPVTGSAYAAIVILFLLFPLVAIAALGATRQALESYRENYPGAVEELLQLEQAMLQTLHTNGVTDEQLAELDALRQQGIARLEARAQSRGEGFWHLVAHNLRTRNDDGNADLAQQFNEKTSKLVGNLIRQDAVGADAVHQFQRLVRGEESMLSMKRDRFPNLLSAFALDSMMSAMITSTVASSADAVVNSGNEALNLAGSAVASEVFDYATSTLLIPAQIAQGISGLMRVGYLQMARDYMKSNAANVAALGDLSPAARAQHEESMRFLLRKNTQAMFANALLYVSQVSLATMALASFAAAPAAVITGPIALGLCGVTIGSALLADNVQKKIGRHAGDGASDLAKEEVDIGDLSAQVREEGLKAVIGATGDQYANHGAVIAQTQLLKDIADSIRTKEMIANEPLTPARAARRSERIAALNTPRKSPPWMGDIGRKASEDTRLEHFNDDFMAQPAGDIQAQLHVQILRHPLAQLVWDTPEYRRTLMYETAKKLEKNRDPGVQALFTQDNGERATELDWTRFEAVVKACPTVQRVYLREANRFISDGLLTVLNCARESARGGIEDLANTSAFYGKAGVDPAWVTVF